MANKEQAVRDAALALQAAITEAVAAGYRVHWPSSPEGLHNIPVSETAKYIPPAAVSSNRETKPKQEAGPATFGTPRRQSEPS